MYGPQQTGVDPGDCERRLLSEACAAYEEIGMPKHVEIVDALLKEIS